MQARLAELEAQIASHEGRLAEMGTALADPGLYRDGDRARDLTQARKQAEEQLAWLMKEWEELSGRLAPAEEPG